MARSPDRRRLKEARRSRQMARQLAGRVFLAPGGMDRVGGRPAYRPLRARLAELLREPERWARLTPRELGFEAHEISRISRRGLEARARALRRWEKAAEVASAKRTRNAQVRRKLEGWDEELPVLREALARLRDWEARREEGGEVAGEPFPLDPDDARRLEARIGHLREAGAPAAWEVVLGIVAWIGGGGAARRLADLLESWLARRTDEERLPVPTAVSGCAALAALDDSDAPLPERFLDLVENPETWGGSSPTLFFGILVKMSVRPGYAEVLAALSGMTRWPRPDRLVGMREVILAGAGSADLDWLIGKQLTHLLPRLGARKTSPAPLRRLETVLNRHRKVLGKERLCLLGNHLAETGRSATFEAFADWLEALPEGSTGPRRAEEVASSVCGLAVAGTSGDRLESLVSRWARPRGRAPAVPGEDAGWPKELTRLLRRMAQYQRWVGEEPRIPGSVRRHLERDARRAEERAWLESREAEGELDANQRERLEALRSAPAVDERALRKALKQARELLPRVTLDTLQRAFQEEVESSWRALTSVGDEGLSRDRRLEILGWARDLEEKDRACLDTLLAAYEASGPGYRDTLQGNREWMEEVGRAGVDVAAWMRPPPRSLRSGELELRLEVAVSPLPVLLMGSFFDTCLGLRDGCNRLAVLSNAWEANKAVLLVRDEEGKVLGRKLVILNSENEMVGFRTYLTWDREQVVRKQVEAAVESYCADWAAAAGVLRGNRGAPRSLTGAFWYDDGIEPWGEGDLGDRWSSTLLQVWEERRSEAVDRLEALGVGADFEDSLALREELLAELGRVRREPELLRSLLRYARTETGTAAGRLALAEVEGPEHLPAESRGPLGFLRTAFALREAGGRAGARAWSDVVRFEELEYVLPWLGPRVRADDEVRHAVWQVYEADGWFPGDAFTLRALVAWGWDRNGRAVPAGTYRLLAALPGAAFQGPAGRAGFLASLPPSPDSRALFSRRLLENLWEAEPRPQEARLAACVLALRNPCARTASFLRERREESSLATTALELMDRDVHRGERPEPPEEAEGWSPELQLRLLDGFARTGDAPAEEAFPREGRPGWLVRPFLVAWAAAGRADAVRRGVAWLESGKGILRWDEAWQLLELAQGALAPEDLYPGGGEIPLGYTGHLCLDPARLPARARWGAVFGDGWHPDPAALVSTLRALRKAGQLEGYRQGTVEPGGELARFLLGAVLAED